MKSNEIIEILEENNLTEIEELKNEDGVFLVKFFLDFDNDVISAARSYANDESDYEEESDEWYKEYFIPYLYDYGNDEVVDIIEEIVEELDRTGCVILEVPKEDINYDKLSSKVCQQYALKEFAENIILLDTGHAKLMTTYYPLKKLRKIKGLENAKYVDPYAGSKGNSIRYLSVAPRTNDLKVNGVDNLFCAGEKSGLFVGHTEAIVTGSLAGHNAVRLAMGIPLLILPSSIAIGDIISYANDKAETREGRRDRYTFAGAEYFKRMNELGLYTTDKEEIKQRISKVNLDNVFNQKLI